MIEDILKDYDIIKLKEMDSVKLMNRKECKYTVSYEKLISILSKLSEEYFILDIHGEKLMPYESIYYDMPDFNLYTSHQNGKQNRYKVRCRTYALTGDSFLELKFKNNKKRTIKKRIKVDHNYDLFDNKTFLEENLPFSPKRLEKKIEIKYKRITLVDKSLKERVTIDLNLSYLSKDKETSYDALSIIEIKYQGERRDSKIDTLLREERIKPLSFSKYCLGISQHYTTVKQNSMNIKIREINKNIGEEVLIRA